MQSKQKNYNQSYLSSASVFNGPQFKTQLCKNHKDNGSCDFGSHCQFAHGIDRDDFHSYTRFHDDVRSIRAENSEPEPQEQPDPVPGPQSWPRCDEESRG